MNLRFLESMGKIRRRSPDKARARSLVSAAENTMRTIFKMQLSQESSTIIFRETYESLRQLGDARWWLGGYEPRDHEVSMEALKEEKVCALPKLQKLDRFRSERNRANYEGDEIPKAVAQEILEFWEECGTDILRNIKKDLET
jgi:hypothetical protein